MILVAVGTHHQPFDRLVLAAGWLAAAGSERVVVQRGSSRLRPAGCEVVDQVEPARLSAWMAEARVVILHGGSSSFLEARSLGRVPILVPRRSRHGEHVDDHQVEFARSLPSGEALVAEPEELPAAVARHREVRARPSDRSGAFSARLGALLEDLLAARVEETRRR